MTDLSEDKKLSDLLAEARALPREIDPPADAWAAIKAEMKLSSPNAVIPLQRSPRMWQQPAFLAAAAAVLVASSSFITFEAMRGREVPRIPITTASARSTRQPGPSTFAEFASVENDYISSANQLSAVLESERSTLSPETVAKLKQSLAVIDAAIIEARRALAADPANRALVDMLNTSYNQKIDLLRRSTEMGQS